ncbi:Uncharacterised protein [Mycobacterium tuberculosis]|nr:Uncharacterised protein [Mycobacterium tuberculosis]
MRVGGGDRRPVVEHGVHQQLKCRCDAATVAGKQSQRRREAAAGTSAADCHPRGVHRRQAGQPGQRRVAVAQGGRIRIFRRQAVVHRCDSDAQSAAEPEAEPIVLLRGAHYVSAGVDPQQRGRWFVAAGGSV